jgi:DNA-binding MarR family transcriptional regulator
LHPEGALIVEDTARSVSPAALYEKLEQVYRLLCGKVGSRSLGSGQGRYLQLLLSRDGVTQAELASLLGVSPSTASELTDKLLAAGHIIREKAVGDKRRVLIFITDSGREAAAAFRQESAGALQDAFDVLPADAQAQLFSLLCGLLEPDKPVPAVCAEPMIRPGKRI